MSFLGPLQNFATLPWILSDGGALDIDLCPDCWERNAHLERYELATRAFPGMHVVDFGCGVGYGSEMLSKAGCVVVSLDTSEQALVLANHRRKGCFVRPGDPLLDAPFGAIVAFEVIEHLDDPVSFFEWAAQRSRHILVSVPVIPTVGINPHHRTDFTPESFRRLVSDQFEIQSEWPQCLPLRSDPVILIVHAINRNPENIIKG